MKTKKKADTMFDGLENINFSIGAALKHMKNNPSDKNAALLDSLNSILDKEMELLDNLELAINGDIK